MPCDGRLSEDGEGQTRAEEVVEDKDESLKPYYNQFCKRPYFHDEYLQTFNNPDRTGQHRWKRTWRNIWRRNNFGENYDESMC